MSAFGALFGATQWFRTIRFLPKRGFDSNASLTLTATTNHQTPVKWYTHDEMWKMKRMKSRREKNNVQQQQQQQQPHRTHKRVDKATQVSGIMWAYTISAIWFD